jgi:LAO/AO transport system kinase
LALQQKRLWPQATPTGRRRGQSCGGLAADRDPEDCPAMARTTGMYGLDTSSPGSSARRGGLAIDDFVRGIKGRDRAMLARAVTLIESTRPADRPLARAVLQAILPDTGRAHRIGITGVPGVGKSTTIDQLGMNLIAAGHRVAVLAVDPTSRRTGGSILGDKTRMQRLSQAPEAFIRPSPTSGTLGGVARRTRETMALVEAAGFDVVIVETVGVGQSETAVADMVDFFLVLLLAGGGDDLQGIKKGIVEIADMIAINKADGDNVDRARRSAAEYQGALNILTPASPSWSPPVVTISGQENIGLDAMWAKIREHHRIMTDTGELVARRQRQAVTALREMLAERLMERLMADARIASHLADIEAKVAAGDMLPAIAVEELIDMLGNASTLSLSPST